MDSHSIRVRITFVVAAALAAATASPTASSRAAAPAVPAHIEAAVAHGARPQDDRARDADRKPGEILSFFGIEPGMSVADLMTGRGYYAELLAHAVGPTGKVFAQNNAFVLKRFAEKAITERVSRPELGHVTRLDRELDDPGLPEGELDAVLMVLFYHDTYWMEIDRKKMNAAIFAALKPGGVYGLIDHHAEDGSGTRDVKTLHRMEAKIARDEILAAGFELDAESDALRHAEDDRTKNVFLPEIRGKTDRFVYRFRKPK